MKARPRYRGLFATLLGVVAVAAVVGVVFRRADPSSPTAFQTPTVADDPIPEIVDLDRLDPIMAQAVRDAVAAVRSDRTSADAWGELGRVYHAHDYIDLARACYQRARRLDREAAAWPYYLAFLAAERGELDVATAHYSRVVELRPDYLPVYFRLGNALLAAERLDEAEATYRRLLELAPAEPWAHLGLGKVARRRDRGAAAARHLERSLELDPDNRQARYLLAMTRIELGQEAAGRELLAGLGSEEVAVLADPMLEEVRTRTRDV
ncbi:MAG: tetratricopeptide repeat protein, partial [Thermoanaerobaculia bacterium]|nr:tetratricopeptide repeat protein [Thermoanaerobaculia bacterium]